MVSDFAIIGRAARAAIPVPALPMRAIRMRAKAETRHAQVRTLLVATAMCLAAIGAGIELSDKVSDGIQLWLNGKRAAAVVRSFTVVRNPMPGDVRTIAGNAAFRITFPVGLPLGSTMYALVYSPAERPTFLQVMYREPNNRIIALALVESSTIGNNFRTLPAYSATRFRQTSWRVGAETVLVPGGVVTPDVGAIRAAMLRTSPDASLAATEDSLPTLTVLGYPIAFVGIAQHLVPHNARAVLLDSWHVRNLRKIVKPNRPLLDDRTVHVGPMPSARGGPNYARATLHWTRTVAVSVGGVRGIEAALRYASRGSECSCEVLFDEPNASTYLVWTIANATPHVVRKYSVDSKTLKVTAIT